MITSRRLAAGVCALLAALAAGIAFPAAALAGEPTGRAAKGIGLTVVDLTTADLGLPVATEVRVGSMDIGGSAAVDGSPGEPLVPGTGSMAESTAEELSSPLSDLTARRLLGLRLVVRPLGVDRGRWRAGRTRGVRRIRVDAGGGTAHAGAATRRLTRHTDPTYRQKTCCRRVF